MKLSDTLRVAADVVAQMEARLAALEVAEPVEPEPTDPEPEEPSAPDPTDDRPAPLIRSLAAPMLVFSEYNRQNRYNRWLPLYVLRGPVSIEYNRMRAGGTAVAFGGMTCTLLCNGEPVATDTPDPEKSIGRFEFDASSLSEGWHIFDIAADGVVGAGVPYPMFVLHGDRVSVEQKWMPVVDDSQHHKMSGRHRIIWVPAKHAPLELPLEPRTYQPFDYMPEYNDLWHDWLIAPRFGGQQHEASINQHGIVSTMNSQRYVAGELHRKYPTHPILDGPRGAAFLHLPTEIHLGTADIPELGGVIHNTYVWDVHGFRKIKPDGSMHTLAGWRHHTPPHWQDDGMGNADEPHPFLELVGDWSEIPEERRGFHNIWGACLDTYSTRQDTDAEKVDLRGVMVHPHPEGVAWFCADTMNNRICKVQHSNASHDVPPKVTEFLTDLAGPFDCKEWRGASGREGTPARRGTLIVSEREAHRISEYDMETGELIRHVVEGDPLAYVDEFRRVRRASSLGAIRAEDVVCPDGIYVIDDWCYYASTAMLQVRRVHLVTGEIQIVVPDYPETIRTEWYIKIAVSDGTAGPKHTVYGVRWENLRFGQPDVFVPEGDADAASTWAVHPGFIGGAGSAAVSRGIGKDIDGLGYNTAVAAKNGRVVWGTHDVGLMQVSLAHPDDPLVPLNLTERAIEKKKFFAARDAWKSKNYDLRYGDNGMGLYGEPLPWNDEEVRAYLEWFGHKEDA